MLDSLRNARRRGVIATWSNFCALAFHRLLRRGRTSVTLPDFPRLLNWNAHLFRIRNRSQQVASSRSTAHIQYPWFNILAGVFEGAAMSPLVSM